MLNICVGDLGGILGSCHRSNAIAINVSNRLYLGFCSLSSSIIRHPTTCHSFLKWVASTVGDDELDIPPITQPSSTSSLPRTQLPSKSFSFLPPSSSTPTPLLKVANVNIHLIKALRVQYYTYCCTFIFWNSLLNSNFGQLTFESMNPTIKTQYCGKFVVPHMVYNMRSNTD